MKWTDTFKLTRDGYEDLEGEELDLYLEDQELLELEIKRQDYYNDYL